MPKRLVPRECHTPGATFFGVCTALDLSSATCYYNLPERDPIRIVVWRADNATSRHLQYLGTVEDGNGYVPRA
jgi:hypothetical protein